MNKQILILALLIIPASLWAKETIMVPIEFDGEKIQLELQIHKPSGKGPFPTLIFNHGSTGTGKIPELFRYPFDFSTLINYFIKRGYAVVLPSRRGRGGSEGLYNEGFSENRSEGYSCDPSLSLPGADRGLKDIEKVVNEILEMSFVNRNQVLLGGFSRGGILSIAFAGGNPNLFNGIINFVGGWLGTNCSTASEVNSALFVRGASYPKETIWLYGNYDQFYPLAHSRKNFDAYTKAGGKGSFHEFEPAPGSSGHFIISFSGIWNTTLNEYLTRIEKGN